jgi:hypothetical protein
LSRLCSCTASWWQTIVAQLRVGSHPGSGHLARNSCRGCKLGFRRMHNRIVVYHTMRGERCQYSSSVHCRDCVGANNAGGNELSAYLVSQNIVPYGLHKRIVIFDSTHDKCCYYTFGMKRPLWRVYTPTRAQRTRCHGSQQAARSRDNICLLLASRMFEVTTNTDLFRSGDAMR